MCQGGQGMRIGLFGGTFNPVHNGHLEIAAKVMARADLEKILFIPSNLPPHKTTGVLADAADRMEMIRLSLPKDPRYGVSDIEIHRKGPSYSIDTIRYFVAGDRKDADYYLLMGLDAFLEIHTWKSFKAILALIKPLVLFRSGNWSRDGNTLQKEIQVYIQSHMDKSYTYSAKRACWQHPVLKPIFFVMPDPVDISSTLIRQALKEGRSVSSYVPQPVDQFIQKKGLYL